MTTQFFAGPHTISRLTPEPATEPAHPLLLVVDPHIGIQRLIKQELSVQGFHVITADGAAQALRAAYSQRPDLVLTEVALPDASGLELMRLLRERHPVPIIFVTASDGQADKVRALELGADDYIVKPFDPDELASRVRAVLRRSTGGGYPYRTLRLGSVDIDLNRRTVVRDGESVHLTRSEWLLLEHLVANSGRVMLNGELLTKVWGPEYRDDVQYLRVWISRLRKKLEPETTDWTLIRTVKGIGYVLHLSTSDSKAPLGVAR